MNANKLVLFFMISIHVVDIYALESIKLKCAILTNGKTTTQAIWHDEIEIQLSASKEKDEFVSINDKEVRYITISKDDNGYLKYEDGSSVYSTNPNESKLGKWGKHEVSIKVINTSDDNLINLTVDIGSKKFGRLEVFEVISIDRNSGSFHSIRVSNNEIGFHTKGQRHYIERSWSRYESQGSCDKYSKKF